MARAACVEFRFIEGANYNDGIEILRKHFMECNGYDFVTQDDELNVCIDFTTEQEMLDAAIKLGDLKCRLNGIFYVYFAMIGG